MLIQQFTAFQLKRKMGTMRMMVGKGGFFMRDFKAIIFSEFQTIFSKCMNRRKLVRKSCSNLVGFSREKRKTNHFIASKITRIIKKVFVMKMKQKHRIIERMVNSNRQKAKYLMFLETDVLFRVKTVEKSKKYMQTVQPFLVDVGYNILGEGQLFIDETAGYAYNVKVLSLLKIKWLFGRLNSEDSIQEGEVICHN